MSGANLPIWGFQGKRSPPSSISCPGEITHHSENSAFPTVSKCPLAEVYSLAKVCSTAQLSQRIKIHPEIQETQCGSPCDPNWEALPRVSRLAGRVISGINTAVFVSPPVLETEPARPGPPRAAGSSHLGTDAIRARGGRPSQQSQGTAIQADPSGGQLGAPREAGGEAMKVQVLQSQEGKRVPRNPPGNFPLEWGWSQSVGQSIESLAVGRPCARTLRRSAASPGAFQMGKLGSREGE